MTQITHNLASVNSRIVAAADCYERNPDSIQLLAVSKKHPSSAIVEAMAWGQEHFGENFVTEAIRKQQELEKQDLQPIWHFIGTIQSNKCRLIAQHFDWVHSLDRIKIARRLNKFRGAGQPLNVLIQINLSDDHQRSGVSCADASDLCHEIVQLPGLVLRGLMAMAPATNDFEVQSKSFARVASLYEQLKTEYPKMMDSLSMGMSQDLEAAVANGASWLRIGTDIFGKRASD